MNSESYKQVWLAEKNHQILITSRNSNYLITYCCCSVATSCPALCHPVDCAVVGFSVLQYLLEFALTHVHWISDAILCQPLLLPPSVFPSIRVFSNELALRIRWPKYWGFSFSISPSNEHSGFISFRIDWFDLLAVQEILKSLLQHHNSKASVLLHSAFFMVQLSSTGLPWWLSW